MQNEMLSLKMRVDEELKAMKAVEADKQSNNL